MQAPPIDSQEGLSDLELVKMTQNGDQEAFGQLYDRYMPKVYKKVWYSIPEQDVEDVAQDIFIEVMKSLKSFRSESKFTTWLWTITKRQIADYYRSKKWKEQQAQVETEISELDILDTHNPATETLDDMIMLRKAMKSLPTHYQEIIYLRFIDGLKFHELAEVIGKSFEGTKSLFRRAVAELQTTMGAENG